MPLTPFAPLTPSHALESTSHLRRSRPLGSSGRDRSQVYPSSQLVSASSYLRPRLLSLPSISAVDCDTESPRSRILCASIRVTRAPG